MFFQSSAAVDLDDPDADDQTDLRVSKFGSVSQSVIGFGGCDPNLSSTKV